MNARLLQAVSRNDVSVNRTSKFTGFTKENGKVFLFIDDEDNYFAAWMNSKNELIIDEAPFAE